MNKRLWIRGIAGNKSGYGKFTMKLVEWFVDAGYDVNFFATNRYDRSDLVEVSDRVKETFVNKDQQDDCVLLIHPPDQRSIPVQNRFNFWYTMWETTKAPDNVISNLNLADEIIVPSSFNISSFSDADNKINTGLVPLGYDSDVVRPIDFQKNHNFTFLVAGTTASNKRKGIHKAVDAFLKAFPENESNSRLIIKITPRCNLRDILPDPGMTDRRIMIIRGDIPNAEMANLYGVCDCYVAPSMGEGFGMHSIEAMATGRPVIAPMFGGTTDFLSHLNSIPVEFDAVGSEKSEADFFYRKVGKMCDVSVDSLAAKMRWIKDAGKQMCEVIGLEGIKTAREYTYIKQGEKLESYLNRKGFF
jgi:glycosyltransferase involved in cell wall biosynthesis